MMKYLTGVFLLVFVLRPAAAQLKRGAEIQDFSLTDVKGKTQKLSTLLQEKEVKGVWLTVWKVGCADCRADLPKMAKTYEGLKAKGLRWIGVAIHTSAAQASEFANQNGMTRLKFINLVDPGKKVATTLKTKATPYTLLIGKNKKVVAVYQGTNAQILTAVQKDATEFLAQGRVTNAPVRSGKG